jgi:hypothetical protein
MKLNVTPEEVVHLIERADVDGQLGQILLSLHWGITKDFSSGVAHLVRSALLHDALGYRQRAVAALLEWREPDGVERAVDNALRMHPTLGAKQIGVSGWNDLLVQQVAKHLDECDVARLIADDLADSLPLHLDVYCKIDFEQAERMLLPFKDKNAWFQLGLAYVHARAGRDDYFDVISSALMVPERQHIALAALVSLQSVEALKVLEEFANQTVLTSSKTGAWDEKIRTAASRCHRFLVGNSEEKVRLFQEQFRLPNELLQALKMSVDAILVSQHGFPIDATSWLLALAPQVTREAIEQVQMSEFRRLEESIIGNEHFLLYAHVLNWRRGIRPVISNESKSGILLDGISIEATVDDYRIAATCWIRTPDEASEGLLSAVRSMLVARSDFMNAV